MIVHLKNNAKKYIAIALTTSLFACNQLPSNVVISPELVPSNALNYQHKTAELEVIDRRNNVHVLQIMKKQKAETLLNSQLPLNEIVHEELAKSYRQSSLIINNESTAVNTLPVHITVYIDTALINVDQDLVEYSATNNIEVSVELVKGNVVLKKSYQQRGASKGPMRADLAVLERDFSQQLGNIIKSILLDKELQTFISA